MPTAIQFLRSSTSRLRPYPDQLSDGMPMVQLNESEPGLYFKLRDDSLCKIGPCAIGSIPPNSNPALQTGNTIGEFWLDTSDPSSVLLKVWDGSAWQNSAPSTGSITLDTVLAAGNTTTNSLTVGGLTSSGITYPTVDGTSNQVIVTDGAGNLSFAPTPAISIDEVLSAGSSTTNSLTVGGITASGLAYPTADGTANQVMVTDGAGNLSFADAPASTIDEVLAAGSSTTNSLTVGGLTSAGLTYPTTDGTANQVIITDGAGNLSFANPATPVTSTLDEVLAAGNTSTSSMTVGAFVSSSISYPTTDGTAGQVIVTDGSGALSFADVAATDVDNGTF